MGRTVSHCFVASAPLLFLACSTIGDLDNERPGRVLPTETVALSGTTVDYFTGTVIPEVPLETLGLAPERLAISDDVGGFELDVPLASYFYVRTGATATYRPTISQVVGFTEPTSASLVAFSEADIRRQHVSAGIEVVPNTTTVIVEITAPGGTLLSAFSRSNIAILDSNEQAIGVEPLVFGSLGDVDPALMESSEGTSARFAFFNVEPGVHALRVTCATCEPAFESSHTLISGTGVTFMRVPLDATQGPAEDSFDAIFGLFGRGADDGLGCANCHTEGGVAPRLDGDPASVRAALIASPNWINTDEPDRSLLLSKPLYETPANHPNATFLSKDEPAYQSIRAWIAGGAL